MRHNYQYMQSSDTPNQPENTANAKVYISNINKNIDQETLRKKFQEFGCIRSCILKKKPNDVTYSFIQYQKPADAALAIAKLNGTQVWERNLKVEYGLGGKKGFQHYMTDAERDRKFGENRRRKDDSIESNDRVKRHHHLDHRGQYRRRSYSRESRYSDSYSPGQYKRRQDIRRRSRSKQRRRLSYSRDSEDSYYKHRQYRQRRRRQYKKRRSISRSSDRRKSRDKNRGYYQPYKNDNYQRQRRDYERQNYKRYKKDRSRSRQAYISQKKHSPDFKFKKYSRQSSERRRYYNDRSEKYDKNRVEGRQRYERQRDRQRQKKPQERFIIQRKQSVKDDSKKRQKYEPFNKNQKDKDVRLQNSYSYKQEIKYRRDRQNTQKNAQNLQRRNYSNNKQSYNRIQNDYTNIVNQRKYDDIVDQNERLNKYKMRD